MNSEGAVEEPRYDCEKKRRLVHMIGTVQTGYWAKTIVAANNKQGWAEDAASFPTDQRKIRQSRPYLTRFLDIGWNLRGCFN